MTAFKFGVISCPSTLSPIRKFCSDSICRIIRFLPLADPWYFGLAGSVMPLALSIASCVISLALTRSIFSGAKMV
ncbi:hypothetical protein D3C72_1968300 [compost metagenome]